jgi:FlaA1/EpsC-like NDP-sugar epimerase
MSDAAAVPETTSGTAKRHRNHIMNHAFNFSNKVIFVTGAGTGIGRATAVTFARAGARRLSRDHRHTHDGAVHRRHA